ncbi:hypothetical protein HPB47_013343 [Ixodes persulcatus]|uniref:Uncharacterized protein n=1 Tax=Ixodes persulcatus TaxID=34615 RepID=A0AC60R260_IXOPE|nr:hypothetical protein HPB47_013343 [Ixodes persulcatus]
MVAHAAGVVVTLLTKHLAPKVQAPPAGLGVRGDATLQTPAFTAATTERKSTSVATNRHSSGTDQHLDMNEEGRRRSERNRIRQTVAAGPPRLPATVATGKGSTSLGGSDDATTNQGGVADQDSERSDTDTVGQRIPLAGPANVPQTIQTGLYELTGDLSWLQTIVQEAVQATVRGAVEAWLTCFVSQPSTRTTQDHLQSPVPDLPPRSLVLWAKESVVIPPNYHRLKSKATLGVFLQSPVDEAWLRHLSDRPSGKMVRCTAESRVTGTLVRQAVREAPSTPGRVAKTSRYPQRQEEQAQYVRPERPSTRETDV